MATRRSRAGGPPVRPPDTTRAAPCSIDLAVGGSAARSPGETPMEATDPRATAPPRGPHADGARCGARETGDPRRRRRRRSCSGRDRHERLDARHHEPYGWRDSFRRGPARRDRNRDAPRAGRRRLRRRRGAGCSRHHASRARQTRAIRRDRAPRCARGRGRSRECCRPRRGPATRTARLAPHRHHHGWRPRARRTHRDRRDRHAGRNRRGRRRERRNRPRRCATRRGYRLQA